MKSAKCSSCGANIKIDEKNGTGICEYCYTPYIIENNIYIDDPKTKFCKYCGQKISEHAIICVHCGGQVEELKRTPQDSPITYSGINSNYGNNSNQNKRQLNKWVSLLLCIFLGPLGAHKFYEGKIIMGILYMITYGLFGIGWIIDIILIALKPDTYYK
ncbi:MAG: TM2 domain-containing protein [Clostridia bacterium]|nr:TM2 domain-containing protein [Clostridia bacterium]